MKLLSLGKLMRSALITILLLVSATANASTITIDFEELAGDGINVGELGPWGDTGALSKGFQFSGSPDTPSMLYGNESTNNSFMVCTFYPYCGIEYGPSMYFSAIGSEAFSLYTFDLNVSSNSCVHVTGREAGTFNDFVLDAASNGFTECTGANYNEPGIWLEAGNHTVSLSSPWTSLESVSIHSHDYSRTEFFGYMAIDNIVVSAVPIPAAVWLFGSALAGLGWFRRRQTA